MTGTVALLEIDDALAAELRGKGSSSVRLAEGFPRKEDTEALRAWGRGALSYVILENGVVVGTCGTHGPPNADGAVELGWGLVAGARGRGVGTAAVAQLLHAAQRRHPGATIVAHTEWMDHGDGPVADSPPSEAILRRLGFNASPEPHEPGYRAWRLDVG